MNGSAYRVNREKVLSLFSQANLTSGVIVYEAPLQPKEPFSESDLDFVQEGLFSWLTGWPDPDASIVMDLKTGTQTLFLPPYTKKYEIWNGPIPSIESIIEKTGVDSVKWNDERDDYLKSLNPPIVFATQIPVRSPYIQEHKNVDTERFFAACSIARTIKSPEEIAALRRGSELTGEAIKATWRNFKWHEGVGELEVQAMFEYHAKLLGCKNVSFLTIVGAGQHSCYLHYSENSGVVQKDDMILLDCGVFYQHYAGDITRTFPASGKFSDDQKLVYNALLKRQIQMVEAVKPGIRRMELQELSSRLVFEALQEVGVLPKEWDYKGHEMYSAFFYPHGLSHHIGCNVHDQCYHPDVKNFGYDYAYSSVMKPGMVISIEPGIYFHAERLRKESESLKGVNMELAMRFARTVGGIRIEDDVLVTETGYDVLSKNCPKSVEEIEALMAHD